MTDYQLFYSKKTCPQKPWAIKNMGTQEIQYFSKVFANGEHHGEGPCRLDEERTGHVLRYPDSVLHVDGDTANLTSDNFLDALKLLDEQIRCFGLHKMDCDLTNKYYGATCTCGASEWNRSMEKFVKKHMKNIYGVG